MTAFRFAAIFVWAGMLAAQDPRGALLGRVQDASGAVITGVTVRAVHTATGVAASATTTNTGAFHIPFLAPGNYRVEAESTGFKRFVRDGIEVRVGDAVEFAIEMQVGSVTETLEVTAQTPLLDTASASVGQVIDQRRILELPQRGGNAMELALLSPGVVNGANLRLRKASSPGATSQVSVDGSGSYNTEFQIDGVSNTGNDTGGSPRMSFSPPPSAVREFRIETSPYDASAGHTPGGVINISTASGTNELHGELHYWAKNSALDAPNFFNNKAGTKITVYQDHRYGASAGGPVYLPRLYNGRNKTFWFYAWEGNKWGVPTPTVNTVPTEAQRNGDFSALLKVAGGSAYQIYNPFSTRTAANGRFQRDPIPGNVIPKSMLDPVGLKLAALYPLPNQTGTADGRNNHFWPDVARSDYYAHMARLDHAFSETHRIFLRLHYAFFQNDKNDRFGTRTNALLINQIKRGMALDDVIVLSPTLVLNLRYGLNNADFLEKRASHGIDLASLGFSPALTGLVDKSLSTIPRVNLGAYTVLSQWQDGDGGNTAVTNSFQAGFTKVYGSHNARFGADYRIYRTFGNRAPASASPDLSYSTNYTRGPLDNSPAATVGQELAAMLLGVPGGSMEYAASYAMQDKFFALYFQDDVKLSSRLTLNVGLRYETEFPLTERFNRLVAQFDSTVANPIEAQARANYARNPIPELAPADFRVPGGLTWVSPGSRSPYRRNNSFMPRVGLAYQLTPKTTVRTGAGLFYDTIGVNKAIALQTGFSQATPIQASLDNGLTYVATNANPLPNGLIQPLGPAGGLTTNLGQGIDFYNPSLPHPYSERWSFNVQRLLPGQFLAEVGYVGNRGTRQIVDRDLNNTPAKYLSTQPTRDQPTIDFLTAQFTSPFAGLNPIYGARVSRANLLRPYPQFGSVMLEDPVGYSWYHSMQARLEKRFSHGYTFQVNYTFAKLMEAMEFLNGTDAMPYESISSMDRPHRVAASGIWEVPVGRGRRFGGSMPGALNFVAGGWQLCGVVIRQAGAPLQFGNIIFNGDIQNIALPKSERSADRWFNTAAGFNRISAQQLANNIRAFPLRLSGARSDGQSSWDFSVLKHFQVGERVRVEFRAEAYNALNHSSFNAPNMAPANSAFGTITATSGDARNWQLALKVNF